MSLCRTRLTSETNPAIVDIARADRAFLGRAVRHVVGEAGVRQPLDIGTGSPTAKVPANASAGVDTRPAPPIADSRSHNSVRVTGGAQARFRAEVAEEEDAHRRQLTAAAFRDYRAGTLPTGPGARDLIAAFEHVDTQLAEQQPGQPTVVGTDRHVELLLAKRAATLHFSPPETDS
jgi:hypothetical protein